MSTWQSRSGANVGKPGHPLSTREGSRNQQKTGGHPPRPCRIVPAAKRGRNPLFDLEVCKANYAEYKRNVTRKRSGGTNRLEAQLRKAKADLEESELKLARLREEVLTATDVEQVWTANKQACLDRIRRFPADIAPALLGVNNIAEASDILETTMRRLLDDLAKIDEADDHADD